VNFFGGLPHGSDPVALNINDIHYRHIRIVGTHGSTPEPNDSALAMIADHRLGVADLITDRIRLDALEDAL
jgi:L-iditol 2-dehydrogenase